MKNIKYSRPAPTWAAVSPVGRFPLECTNGFISFIAARHNGIIIYLILQEAIVVKVQI